MTSILWFACNLIERDICDKVNLHNRNRIRIIDENKNIQIKNKEIIK